VIPDLAVLVQYRRVTDGQTDGRTDRHTTTVYTASRGKNKSLLPLTDARDAVF